MGNKGDKLTNNAEIKAVLILEKLAILGNVSSKKMFGGYGIFIDGKMFAMVDSNGVGFLKVDENLKNSFAKIGSIPHSKMPYSSIPENIIADNDSLIQLAHQSVALVK